VALGLEAGDDLRAVVALDLDDAVLCGAARPAEALEVARDRVEVASGDTADDGHRLAAAAARLTRDAHDPVVRGDRLGGAAHVAAAAEVAVGG